MRVRDVFDLACEYGTVKRAGDAVGAAKDRVERRLKRLVKKHCGVLREYRQAAGDQLSDYCVCTGLTVETLYRIEGGELDGVPLDAVEAVLDTYASGYSR